MALPTAPAPASSSLPLPCPMAAWPFLLAQRARASRLLGAIPELTLSHDLKPLPADLVLCSKKLPPGQ